MLVSDIISKWPASNLTLPLNSVTALIGIPVVIYVILKSRKIV
jgi:iron complex transport system permease protein